nr:hypothetical protein [Tanacetum cinerariifolium]
MVLVATPLPADTTATSSSTTIDQDVPYASSSSTYQEIKSQVIHQYIEEQIHGHHNVQFDNAPILHNLSSDPSSEEITLQGIIPSSLHHLNQSFDTLAKLKKNHPLENVISDPSRSVLTRSQLQEHVISCYFDANDNLIPFGGKRSEHQSDTQVITVKMEILLEPTSNKLLVERFDTSAGNPIKEILLKLNPPDHRILKDGGEGI